MSNSPLVEYTRISPNRGNRINGVLVPERNHEIDTISIHCVVGQLTVETMGVIFSKEGRKASCNYGVAKDGKIGMYCEEKDRSWCTSSQSNDNRAITIEVASDTKHPYAVRPEAYKSLIKLLVDICKRNGIPELRWQGDKSLIGQVDKQNMTVHRWFANKACPGEWLYSRHGQIAAEVNAQLNGSKPALTPNDAPNIDEKKEKPYLIRVKANYLNFRTGPSVSRAIRGFVRKGEVYTIVEEQDGWGKLKSGAGWVSLKYCEKI